MLLIILENEKRCFQWYIQQSSFSYPQLVITIKKGDGLCSG